MNSEPAAEGRIVGALPKHTTPRPAVKAAAERLAAMVAQIKENAARPEKG